MKKTMKGVLGKSYYTLRWKVLLRDNFTCQYCGQHAPDVVLHVDHKIAKANGGTNSEDNLITSCIACNVGKNISPLIPTMEDSVLETKPISPLKAAVIEILQEKGVATATELATLLQKNRSQISWMLNNDSAFEKVLKGGRNTYFKVIPSL